MIEPETYKQACEYLDRIPMSTGRKKPGKVSRLLSLLGSPEKSFRVIHVAGTNGKGSTCAFLESIFRLAGRKTGLFTSPHLVRINERIRVMGQSIPDEGFLESFTVVRKAAEKLEAEGYPELGYFEYLFAMGMVWFERCEIDILICETGIGGRLDTTNSIDRADAVVITSISLDHTGILGDTVEEIALEKAGIIRRDTPVIYRAGDPAAARVIARRAEEMNAEQIPLEPEACVITARDTGSITALLLLPAGGRLELRIPFDAEYQAENACLAALCALCLGADKDTVRAGIARTRWPGRMDEIRPGVFLDGAHNPDGIRAIASEIRRIARTRRVRLFTAVVSDKNHMDMVRELCRDVQYESVIVTSVGGSRQLDTKVLAQEFRQAGQRRVESEPDTDRAWKRALREKGDSVLVCTGSLYLVGRILEMERSEGDSNAEL